jgi:uncharacterized protein (TIGR01777 family)
MTIVIVGGTGFIGRALCRTLVQAGHRVTVLSRSPEAHRGALPPPVAFLAWDGSTRERWAQVLAGADAVVNLAGENIAKKRWTDNRKEELRKSRLLTTHLLVQAMAGLSKRPAILINASAIGYYGPRDETPVSEWTTAGTDFLADLCVAWEQEASGAEALGLRVVRLRIGLVLGEDGGALPRMVFPFRLFLGGPISPGSQWISWVHRHDLANLIHWTLSHPEVHGAVNGVAPGAVTMDEFCRTLGRVLDRPCWLPVPEIALRIALGELATLLTTGQRVEPTVALRAGFAFQYPSLEPALQSLLRTTAESRDVSKQP